MTKENKKVIINFSKRNDSLSNNAIKNRIISNLKKAERLLDNNKFKNLQKDLILNLKENNSINVVIDNDNYKLENDMSGGFFNLFFSNKDSEQKKELETENNNYEEINRIENNELENTYTGGEEDNQYSKDEEEDEDKEEEDEEEKEDEEEEEEEDEEDDKEDEVKKEEEYKVKKEEDEEEDEEEEEDEDEEEEEDEDDKEDEIKKEEDEDDKEEDEDDKEDDKEDNNKDEQNINKKIRTQYGGDKYLLNNDNLSFEDFLDEQTFLFDSYNLDDDEESLIDNATKLKNNKYLNNLNIHELREIMKNNNLKVTNKGNYLKKTDMIKKIKKI